MCAQVSDGSTPSRSDENTRQPRPDIEERDRCVCLFQDLEREFRDSLEYRQKEVTRFGQTLAQCHSLEDLRKQVHPATIAAFAHGGEKGMSPEEMLTDRDRAQKLYTEYSASDCGIDHLPEAARLVLHVFKIKLVKLPLKVWRNRFMAREPWPKNDDDRELRKFWCELVVPGLKEHCPERFSVKSDDVWSAAHNHIAACGLLAELIRDAMTVVKMKIRGEAAAKEADPEPFVPTPTQKTILEKLDGKAMKARQLAVALHINQPKLYEDKGKKGKLKELMQLGKVKKHRRIGYYRPDAPPPELGGGIKEVSTRG